MKGYKGKLGILSVVLILALGSLGVGYAHWTKTIAIVGTAEIGLGDPGFTGQWAFFPYELDPETTCTCNFIDSNNDGDYDTMQAIITNIIVPSSPSSPKLYSRIRNDGTLPMRIDDIQISYTSPYMVVTEESTIVGAVLDPGDGVTCKLLIDFVDATAGVYIFSVKIISSLWSQ